MALGLGTAAFSMQDVLLEPYGGQILGLSVSATTTLTASLALGGLIGFSYASRVLSRGVDPFRMASNGVLFGMPGFALVILAAPFHAPALFALGVLLIGFGGGLFSHGTLTATMNLAPRDQVGLALGAWGAVQATAAGVAMALGGVMRDVVTGWAGPKGNGPMLGYASVYALEIALLLAALVVMMPLLRRRGPVTLPV
jgi:BCD family chlorophyll transporter-like MFS transporter